MSRYANKFTKQLKNKINNNKGITLIALVVTIIVLIILTTISVNLIVKDDGIINKAESAQNIQKMAEEKERLELIKTSVAIDNKGKVPLDKYIEELIKEGIAVEDEIEDNEDGSKQVTTDNGYSINLKQDGEYNVIITVEGKAGSLPVRILNVKLKTSANSIEVNVEVQRGEGATYKYYYKTDDTVYKLAHEGKEKSYTIENLEKYVKYTIKVEAINENGAVYKEAVGKTGEIPNAVGIIEFGNLSWNNGQAEVTITKNTSDDLKIQYQVLDEELNVVKSYQEITSGEKITGLNLGETVQARLWDGTVGGNTASLTVTDTTAPSVSVTKGSTSTNSIGVTVSATDAQAGMPTTASYSYYIKKTSETSYPTTATATNSTASYIFTGLAQNTSYDIKVTVADKAGNTGIGELTGTTTGEVTAASGAITFGNLIWNSNTASVTVTKSSTTSEDLNIEYKVTDSSGTITTDYATIANGGNINNLNLDDVVTVRLTDGTNYGSTASLTVTDTTAPNAATITLSSTTTNPTDSITATVTQSDSQSGVNITSCRWVYSKTSSNIGTGTSSYPYTFSTTPQTLTLQQTTEGTYYLHVLTIDKAGNKIETVSEAITVEKTIKDIYSKIQEYTVTTQDSKGNQVVIPGGFKIAEDSGTTVQQGIVIEDSNQNQFVWIPVSNINNDGSNKVILDDGSSVEITLGRYTFDEETGEVSTTTGTYQYASSYTSTVTLDSYYQELSTFRESNQKSDSTGTNATAKDLAGFVNSVSKNKGYYLARYEASYASGSEFGVGESNTYYKPASKVSTANSTSSMSYTAGTLWNKIRQGNASIACRQMYYGDSYVESDLVNGYAWDTAIVYIQAMGNSNYANANCNTTGNKSLLNTGETGDEKCKIFDMAGNLSEWTTEYSRYSGTSSTYSYHSTDRGGYFANPNSHKTRTRLWNTTASIDVTTGFRSTLYIKN